MYLNAVTTVSGGFEHGPVAPTLTFNSCTYDLFFAEPLICVARRYIKLRRPNFLIIGVQEILDETWIDSLEPVELEKTGPEAQKRLQVVELLEFRF